MPYSLVSQHSDSSTASQSGCPKQLTPCTGSICDVSSVKIEHCEEKLASNWVEEEEQHEDFLELVFKPISSEKFRVFDTKRKHIQKTTNQASNDYRKNICAYITKKVIREFISESYQEGVLALCSKHECTYADVRSYYIARVETVTGLRHLADMLEIRSEQERPVKAVFK